MYVEDHVAADPIDGDGDEDEDDDDDDDDPDDHSTETGTTISTIDETLSVRTRSRITDFALIYWLENDIVNPDKDDEEDEIFSIDQEFIAALIEIKRSASRKLTGEDLADAQKALMLIAQETVFRQVINF